MTEITLNSTVTIITGPYTGHRGIVVVILAGDWGMDGNWGMDGPYGIYLPTENLQLWMNDDEFRIDTTKRKGVGLYEFNTRFH